MEQGGTMAPNDFRNEEPKRQKGLEVNWFFLVMVIEVMHTHTSKIMWII